MATTTNTTNDRGNNITPALTLTQNMLLKHKLRGNTVGAQRYVAFRNDKKVRHFSRMFSTYRLLSHGVTAPRLAAPLRSMAHYFAIPMTKTDWNAAKAAPEVGVAAVAAPAAE